MQKYINFEIRNDLNISIKKEKTYWNEEDELNSNLEEIDSSESKCIENIVNFAFPTNMETKELNDNSSENNDNNYNIYNLNSRKQGDSDQLFDQTNLAVALKKKRIRKEYFKIIKAKKYRYIKQKGRPHISQSNKIKHDKFFDDNIIIKIKTYFFNKFLPDIVNKNVKNKKYFIKKVTNNFIRKIEAQTNLKLLDTAYANFLKKENISKKYSKYLPEENKNIVNKILKENEQIEVIRILNLKIGELFEIFRRKLFENEENITYDLKEKIKGLDLLDNNNKYKDFNFYINDLKEKEEMSKEKFIEYQNKLKQKCIDYKEWFKKRAKK